MRIEMLDRGNDGELSQAVVHYDGAGGVRSLASEMHARGLRIMAFVDGAFFADATKGVQLCREMRTLDMNFLWSAFLDVLPSVELLEEMRLAGCQRLEMELESDDAATALSRAREFGFDIRIRRKDGTPYAVDSISYSVAEREAIAKRLPGLHTVQFDLAVAYYKARRFGDVMLPLGKAMTLRFPINELCLNLLACLSAAKHYPDMAAGLLRQAENGCPHPVVFRNRQRLQSWLESGGDVKGIRLMLEPSNRQGDWM